MFLREEITHVKKIIVLLLVILMAGIIPVSAVSGKSGWEITYTGAGIAQIGNEVVLEGRNALHIQDIAAGEEVTVKHLMGATGSVKRNFRVTFYMKGDFNDENIMVGTGTKTTGADLDVITYMPLSHEKVQQSAYKDGWKKYSYLFKGSVANNAEFKFVFGETKEAYLDDVTITYDSASDDISYIYEGQGILPNGGFEEEITDVSGEDCSGFGWSTNLDKVTTTGVGVGAAAITPVARVVEDNNGNKMLYARMNSANWVSTGLILTKTIGKTGWEDFYVSFKAKGVFLPNAIEVGSSYDNQLKKLAGGVGSSVENPYGDDVKVEALSDGWKKYTVKTHGEGTVFRLKFNQACAEIYLDDFSVVTAAGSYPELVNGSFDEVKFDSKAAFAEGWHAENAGEKNFAQRGKICDDWGIFLKSDSASKPAGFYQTLEGLKVGTEYIISFDTKSFFSRSALKVGFGESIGNFKGTVVSSSDATWQRRSVTVTAEGSKLIFASSGICDGVWIDKVSVVQSGGSELIKNGDFTIKTQPPTYYAGPFRLYKSGVETGIGAGHYTVGIEVENNFCNDDKEFTLIVCHNRSGQMVKYAKKAVRLDANGDVDLPTELKCDIDLSDYKTGDSLEVFLWDNENDMNSLRSFGTF